MNAAKQPVLYGFWRSTATWRVRIGLALKGIEYTYRPIDLIRDGGDQHSDEYRTKNPMRQVPLLELEDGGRPLRLAQSVAILEYLEERWPAPRLLPESRPLRARTRQLVEMINSGIQPLQNTSVQQRIKGELGRDEKAWIHHWVSRGLAALEAVIVEEAGRFAVGDQVTLADLFLVPQLSFSRRFAVPLGDYPTLLRIEAACAELPAFRRAHADRQPDAEP